MSHPLLFTLDPGPLVYEFGSWTHDDDFRGERQVAPKAPQLGRILEMLWRSSSHFYLVYCRPYSQSDVHEALSRLPVPQASLTGLAVVRRWLGPVYKLSGLSSDGDYLVAVGNQAQARWSDLLPLWVTYCTAPMRRVPLTGSQEKLMGWGDPILAKGSELVMTAACPYGVGYIVSIYGDMQRFLDLSLRPTAVTEDRSLRARGRYLELPGG